ncbi:MAG: ABC transporter ATP-binding protein [Acidobacteria bacterium]|nr:ABC transporter ATP-binding protein [Acidobacteriota bacterium]
MPDIAVRMEHVYKRFRKGQMYDSLRDLIPALTGRIFFGDPQPSRSDREFWALQDVSFEVKTGEAFGIIGPNGAGKSTMLKLLSRIMKPTRGSLQVRGRLSALIELSAGFHPDLTGRENIYLYGTILGMTKREIASKLDEIIDFSGLDDFIDTPVKRYSSGMYARLGFSVAAFVNPDVLVVDEVLSVGDTLFRRKCIDRMRSVIHSGATVLFVSHDMKSVADFCSRALLLDRGHPITIGPTPDVIAHYMNSLHHHRATDQSRPIVISSVTVRDETGPCQRFESGQKAWIDIEVSAHEPCSQIAVGLFLLNEMHDTLFTTSTERLGHGNVSLNSGDVFKCTFEVDLNLGRGVFYPSVLVCRYATSKIYDNWESAATIYVWSKEDITGAVNCFPKVTSQELYRKDYGILTAPPDLSRGKMEAPLVTNSVSRESK